MAVEDGSSSNPDQQKDAAKTSSEEVVKPVRLSFVDRVRVRMQSSEVSIIRLLAGESEESTEEEDDESEASGENTLDHKSSKGRFSSLRGLLIPRPETIRDEPFLNDQIEHDVVRDAQNLEGGDESRTLLDAPSESSDVTESDVPRVIEGFESSRESTRDTPNDHSEVGPVEAPPERTRSQGEFVDINNTPAESVYTILQRRQQEQVEANNTFQEAPIRVAQGNSEIPPAPSEGIKAERPANPTGALLAVDVLNYAVARRRDAKNEAASVGRDKKIIQDQKQQNAQFIKELQARDVYQEELAKRIEKSEKQQSAPLPKVRNVELRPRREEAPIQNVEKNATSTEFIGSDYIPSKGVDSNPRIEERVFTPPSDVVRPDAETILHTVEQAAEKSVPIEAQYELRHEHKGNDTFSGQDTQGAGLRTAGGSGSGLYSSPVPSNAAAPVLPGKRSDMQDRSDYKQVASTGVLGAVVGALLFIVLYIFTR